MTHKLNILDVHAYTVGPKADGRHFHATVEILAPITEAELAEAFGAALKARYQMPADFDIHVVTFGHLVGETWMPGPDTSIYTINGQAEQFTEPERAENVSVQ